MTNPIISRNKPIGLVKIISFSIQVSPTQAQRVFSSRRIANRNFDVVKENLENKGGGFVGLKKEGELGVLQVADAPMVKEYQDFLLSEMMRISGYGSASFGETVGANTSGDALSMYFNPTQKSIDDQNLSWQAFYEGINSKILRYYNKFLSTKDEIPVSGYTSSGTLVGITSDDKGQKKVNYSSGSFSGTITKADLEGKTDNIAIPKSATPRDEIQVKRLALEAVKMGVLSRTTAYEDLGIISPQDELDLLKAEQEDPALNPQGMASLMKAMPQDPAGQGGATPPPEGGLLDDVQYNP